MNITFNIFSQGSEWVERASQGKDDQLDQYALSFIKNIHEFGTYNFYGLYHKLEKKSNIFEILDKFKNKEPTVDLSIKKLAKIYGEDIQEKYNRYLNASIEMTHDLKKNHDLTYYQVLALLGFLRFYICSSNYHFPSQYGFPRKSDDEFETNISHEPYLGLLEKLKKYVSDTAQSSICVGMDNRGNIYELSEVESIIVFEKAITRIVHSHFSNIKPGLEYVEFLYNEALNYRDHVDIIRHTGKIFWWICQLKPWILGDPSIAEMFFRIIWKEKGISAAPWKEDIIPWVEVTAEFDDRLFAEKFHEFFDWPS